MDVLTDMEYMLSRGCCADPDPYRPIARLSYHHCLEKSVALFVFVPLVSIESRDRPIR